MMTSSDQRKGKAAERHRSKSERFCAFDANVTFVSRDEVLFMVHRKNLDTHAEGFAPTGIATPPLGEAVALPEASAVLDLLFQYMYPQRQPDLTKVEFSILAQLSEAAEKYQVYSAMENLQVPHASCCA